MSSHTHRSALDALWEARRAWERTQPQYSFDFAALDEQPAPAYPPRGLLVECVGTGSRRDGGPTHSTDRRVLQ